VRSSISIPVIVIRYGRLRQAQSQPKAGAGEVATWGETGIGILYSQADGAHVCFSRMANYYVALNAYHFPGPRSMTMGDVVLKSRTWPCPGRA